MNPGQTNLSVAHLSAAACGPVVGKDAGCESDGLRPLFVEARCANPGAVRGFVASLVVFV